jgi:hypothetical protein
VVTYAPAPLKALVTYLATTRGHPTSQFGVVGNTAHVMGYHLGRDRIFTIPPGLGSADYSIQTARDKAGLSDAAAAIDIKFESDFLLLRRLSVWLVEHCRTNAPGTSDIREVIYSPDGTTVLRWDRQRGVTSAPRQGEADNTHRWHTHVSYYRDSEARDKTAPFRRFFEGGQDVVHTKPAGPFIGTTVIGVGHALISPANTRLHYQYLQWPGGTDVLNVVAALDIVDPQGRPMDIEGNVPPQHARDQVYLVDLPGFGASAFALRQDCTFTPP